MSELKPGWTRVMFGEVVRQSKEKADPETSGLERYVAGEHMDTDDLRIRRWGTIGDGYLGPAFTARFRPGQVLYGSRRTYLRKVALADFDGICANTTFVLESANPQVLLPELLPYIMQTESFHAHSKRESKGSVNPYVNFSDLAWFEFALPPLEEQMKVLAILQTSTKIVDSSRNLLVQSNILVQSFVKCSVTKLSSEWEMVELGSVTNISIGRTPSSALEGCWSDKSGIPFVTPGDFGSIEPYLSSSERHVTRFGASESRTAPVGSSLLVCIGSTIGKVARVQIESVFNQQICCIEPIKISSMFLFLMLAGIEKKLKSQAGSTAVPIVNKSNLMNILIPLPDISIQLKLERIFESLLRSHFIAAHRRNHSSQLHNRISHQLLPE